MAGKPKPMSQIKQLLRLHQQGNSIKSIARKTGLSRNTVKAYLNKLRGLKMDIPALLELEDPVLEAKFHAGNPAYKDPRYDQLKSRLDYFAKELTTGVGITKHLLWEEYREAVSPAYGYSQFCYHLSQYMLARKPSMVVPHKPADQLYMDFAGKTMSYTDPATGEVIPCQVFVACLPYSDYAFAMAVPSQTLSDFIYALGCCLQDLGGVPAALVPDNMKSAVTKANRYEPDINRAMEDFANHYGCVVIPARAAHPKDKALVENGVRLIYNRVYARLRKQQFFDLSSLNKAIREKVKRHNQTRMQQKPYSREECFLAEEKHLLSLLPDTTYEIKHYKELKVAKNNHVLIWHDQHYYSAPYQLIGTKVKVVLTRSMVRIYSRGQLVASHVRNYQRGKYTTVKEHLCSHHQHYLSRSPEYYKKKARAYSQTLFHLFELIFAQDRHPEQLYKSCDGILSYSRKTDKEVFDKACKLAIDHQNYSYSFVSNIIKNKMTDQEPETPPEKPLPKHGNIRGKEYFIQSILNF
ncbi:MAG: IS21 family transposase [Bacteroidetes bacterium]|nr:MAG: IS21 family transposase [Bacteroidota bacterium]